MLLGRHDLRGYEWKVIVDPTRCCDEPGLFYGRLFRKIDVALDRDEISTWPDGIVFEHIYNKNKLTFSEGKLIDLTHSIVLGRKPRAPRKRQPSSITNLQEVNP